MVVQGLSLTSPNGDQRRTAQDFVRSIIDLAGPFGAPAIIGSMQGRWGNGSTRAAAIEWLAESLDTLGTHAKQYGVPLIYEPLNRYETNLINTLADGVVLIRSLSSPNVRLLADLFHMNIEESDPADAIRQAGPHIGHVHLADSNRQPAGRGHTDFGPLSRALREIDYQGYVSAEALPIPDSCAAAQLTISAFRKHFVER